ncbi:MAG: hypothetical protein ABI132_06065 [Rhodanobacteraceae bacterium]
MLGKRILAFALLASLSAGAMAQVGVNVNLNFGTPVIDNGLSYVGPYYGGDYDPFIDDVVTRYDVPRPYVRQLIYVDHVPLRDVLLISAYSRQVGWPVERVYGVYREDHGRGWGAIAPRLGIKPGSREFHEMKNRLSGDPILVRAYHYRGHHEDRGFDRNDHRVYAGGQDEHGHGHGGEWNREHGNGDHGGDHGHGHDNGHDHGNDHGDGHGHGKGHG